MSRAWALPREELDLMIRGYNRARGWTEEGLVPDAKLRELDLLGCGWGSLCRRFSLVAEMFKRVFENIAPPCHFEPRKGVKNLSYAFVASNV